MKNYKGRGIRSITTYIFLAMFIHGLLTINAFGGSIVDTKHNLSISGPGTIKSTSEDRICIFCHTPHNARRDIPYLWNKASSTVNYVPYQSSTLYATVGQPTGASKLCLSCHDGTIALGALVSEQLEIPFTGGIRFMPVGPSKLGTGLSDDHPVSFIYSGSLAATNGELTVPASLPIEVKLDSDNLLQCTSCHDPHDDSNGQFLVMPNDYSNLCITCHSKDGWSLTSHSISNATWNSLAVDPWLHTSFTTVSQNGCENCHSPHSSGGHERLLNYAFEEDNCIVCHNGNVAAKDINAELNKFYNHPVQYYLNIHDPVEDFTGISVQDHVECTDCHNPHWANSNPSPGAPQVSGSIDGVTGINSSGQQIPQAVNQYEICFKCHADNNVISVLPIDRQYQQLNTRLEFEPSNPSYHPVESAGANPNVTSLLLPYNASSIIFCTDCHANDNPAGPAGPHGSTNKYLLKANYTTQDYTNESPSTYALCYDCHYRNSIINNESFTNHSTHIVTADTPCSVCHDAHGVSATQGNSTNNTHLINFDITVVQQNSQGLLKYEDLGAFSGRCYLTCHGVEHNPKAYP